MTQASWPRQFRDVVLGALGYETIVDALRDLVREVRRLRRAMEGHCLKDMEREKLDIIISKNRDKFPGKVIRVVYCVRALPGAAERAGELGIWLLEEERELTPFPD